MSLDVSRDFIVVKRNGRYEPYIPDKALATLHRLSFGIDVNTLDLNKIVQIVDEGIVDCQRTQDIQHELCLAAASLAGHHPDYALLAGRLAVAELHRSTQKSFAEFVLWLAQMDPGMFSDDFVDAVATHGNQLDHALRHARDYDLNYLSVKSLEKSYLLRYNDVVVERPQWLYMRVAVALHGGNLARIVETYELLSKGFYTHATPTLINAGRQRQALSSCFIVPADCSTPTTTYDGLRDIANIFAFEGGIGLDLHTVPAKRPDRPQAGIVPYLRVVDATVQLASQNTNGRPSALTATLPIWHPDIFDFLELKSNRGQEELRTRNIFTAVMIPDLFMHRVKENGTWSLFDPRDAPELLECFGTEFEAAYTRLEKSQLALTVIRANVLWEQLLDAQIETGGIFVLYHDAINAKSNHKHLGVIHASNLCTEIVQHVSHDTTAVCTLSSLILPAFVTPGETFDFVSLHNVAKIVVRNTDRVLDVNEYPTPQAKRSAETTRAIGIGVQGLADVFMMLHIPYDSDEATALNRDIFETLYHAALEASCELAREHGPYPTWAGSPASQLQLQFDLWRVQPSSRYDWDTLKARIRSFGLRNSMLIAQMPTVSTSQIGGVNDGTEPYLSNLYNRRTLAGEFQVLNGWLVRDLALHGLWNEEVRELILRGQGSIQHIASIPPELKNIYKTAWEIPQKRVVDMAAARGPYVCQSQSMSIYMAAPTLDLLTSMHFYAWKRGLKTGLYYLRSRPAIFPDNFGLMPLQSTSDSADRHLSNVAVAGDHEQSAFTPDDDQSHVPMDVPPAMLDYPAVEDLTPLATDSATICLACTS